MANTRKVNRGDRWPVKIREKTKKSEKESIYDSWHEKNNISVPPTISTASALPFLHIIKPIVTFN